MSPWGIQKLSIIELIKDDNFSIENYPYTILNEKFVYRNFKELAELSAATGQAPKLLACFRPERLVLHEVIAASTVKIKFKNEEDMRDFVGYFIQKNKEKITPVLELLELERSKLEQEVRNNCNFKDLDEKTYNTLKFYYKGDTHDSFKKTAIALILDKKFKEIAEKKIKDLIDNLLNEFLRKKPEYKLNAPKANERLTLMVCGGQASGKGSTVARFKANLEKEGINWDQIAKVNTDSYKPLVLALNSIGVDPKKYSQLTQEEASLIHLKIQAKLEGLSKTQNAPHVLFDQVFLGKDKLQYAIENNGKAIVSIVSTDVETAIERSYTRGEKEGRYEDTEGILSCHKNMTEQVPKNIAEFVSNNSQADLCVNIALVDNNVEKDAQPDDVMNIDVKEKKFEVLDQEKLERFVKKTAINPKAKSLNDLYTTAPMEINKYLEPLVKVGFSENHPYQSSISRPHK